MHIERHCVNQRMSKAVVYNGAVYLCGQVGVDFNADVKHQTTTMLEKIDQLLNELGSGRDRLLSVTLYLSEIKDFSSVNEVWETWVPPGKAPARTCVVATMAHPDILVEATVTAALLEFP